MLFGSGRTPRLLPAGVLLLLAAVAPPFARAAAYQFLDEAAEDEHAITFKLAAPSPWPKAAEARLAFCFTDDANHYVVRFGQAGVALLRVANGRESALTGPRPLPDPQEGGWDLALIRRDWTVTLTAHGRLLLRVHDDMLQGGRIGWSASAGANISDVALQPLGEIWLDDDFMREGGEEDAWEAISGKWELRGARSPGFKPDWSANPFSYCGSADFGGMAVTGYWFWDNYRITAAVKAPSRGAIGLVCRFVDPQNYVLFRWTRDVGLGDQPAVGRQQLIRVFGGKWQILADRPGPWSPNQWYELGLAVCDAHVKVSVDGQVTLQAREDVLAHGRTGLYVADCYTAYFDDVRVRDYKDLVADFGVEPTGPMTPVAGEWQCQQNHLYGTPRAGVKHAAAVTGSAGWRNYRVTVAVKPKGAAVGVYAAYRGPRDYYLFRWGPDEREGNRYTQQIIRVAGGQGRVLSKRPCDYSPDAFSRIAFTVDRGYLAASVNGGPPIEAADPAAAGLSGKAGLHVEGADKTACFDDLKVSFLGGEPQAEPIRPQFTVEESMANWARGAALWRAVDDKTQAFDTPLFGDFRLEADLPNLQAADGALSVLLCTTEDATQPAAVLKLVSKAGENSLAGVIEGEPEGLAGGPVTATEEPPHLVIDRRGGCLLAWLDGQPLAAASLPRAAGARWLALRNEGLAPDLERVTITSPKLSDCLFSTAPTGWVSALGNWEITDRWACTAGWAWLGSSEPNPPLLLSKAVYGGDLQVDFWAALGHPYADVGNLNALICANAPSLCSGYSFIYAGDGNTASKILRGNEVVLTNNQVLFPGQDVYHRHWFHTRIRKFGNTLSYWVDGNLVGTYTDPNPLPDGRIGFWTFGNARMLIARARIAAEQQRLAP